jgi:hypothetical protein
MNRFFHRKPYLIILAATAICALMLLFLNVIAYAQGAEQTQQPSALKHYLEMGALLGLMAGGLAFTVGYIWNLWRKYRIEEEKDIGETWRKLAESRLADTNRLEAEKIKLEANEKTLRERLRKQKKLTLRLIAKIEGDGTEFDESEEL